MLTRLRKRAWLIRPLALSLVFLLLGGGPALSAIVPVTPGIDSRDILVDITGSPTGVIANPFFTSVVGGGSAASATDESVWTAAVNLFNPTGGVFNDSAATLSSGQQGTQRFTPNRAGHVNLRNQAGTEIGTAGAPLRIDPTGGTTQPVSGTVTANVGTTNGLALDSTVTTMSGKLPAALVGGRLSVDGSGVTQPVSGTVMSNQGAQAVSGGAVGSWFTQGPTGVGGPIVARPFQMAGENGGVVSLVHISTIGSLISDQGLQGAGGAASWQVQGPDVSGAGIIGRPFGMGISDGTNAQYVKQTTAATGTTGVGLLGTGPLLFDTVGATNYVKQAGDGSGRAIVVGAAAAGAASSGNPVAVGIKDNAGNIQIPTAVGANGSNLGDLSLLACAPMLRIGSSTWGPISASNVVDGINGNQISTSHAWDFNGTTFDRHRNNVDAILLASAARTTTQTSADIVTYNAGAITVIYDNTVGATYSDTLTINGKDPASGKYYPLLTSAAIATVTTNVYVVDPTIPAVVNVSAQKRLPRIIQIVVTAGNANSHTYSIGYTLQPT